MSGNNILFEKHYLFLSKEYRYHDLGDQFAGKVIFDLKDFNSNENTRLYLTGNVEGLNFNDNIKVYVISELSTNYTLDLGFNLIGLGNVPINIHNIGIQFRNIFDTNVNYFEELHKEHEFQELTESNKPFNSNRNGIYMCNVHDEGDERHFHLLRCSTNLKGPTENFKLIDKNIIRTVNSHCKDFFEKEYDLNHVLAQTYFNKIEGNKLKKGKIKLHSDKTKDMQENGIMAFTTFYDGYYNCEFNLDGFDKVKQDGYDYKCENFSVLTRLRFKLKKSVNNNLGKFVENFYVTLYPNSVFVIPLYMNRLYCHEICPPVNVSLENIPTRIGYVIRCSKTRAKHVNDKTYIIYGDEMKTEEVELKNVDEECFNKLKEMYYQENVSCEKIHYERFNFSLNDGDYLKPNI